VWASGCPGCRCTQWQINTGETFEIQNRIGNCCHFVRPERGRWDDYGTIHTIAGQVTITEPASRKVKVVGTNIVTNQSFQNEMTLADMRNTVQGGAKVTATTCVVSDGRYFITLRYKMKTRMGDDFEFEAKNTGTNDWQLYVNQWRQAGTDNPFTPFLTRWSSKAN